jgi:DNA-binding HxlR family transcriptional regulator
MTPAEPKAGGRKPTARAGEGAPGIPLPGRPVRGSSTGRPIMALLDLLGRRWALRVIWELRGEPVLFRALQERCEGMSSSVLNQRLQELRAAGVLELADGGYRLTAEGRRLLEVYAPLDAWAERWAARIRRESEGRADASPARPR